MRHYPDVEPGTMEFLFVSALFWAKEKGYDSFSLGLSAIAGVGEEKGDPQTEKALHLLSTRLSRFFDFAGLRKFKDKFNPTWEPRYLIYDSPANLPAAVTGLIEVHSSKTILQTMLGKK
jgi:phosphatidylglycerol lysyltransferase